MPLDEAKHLDWVNSECFSNNFIKMNGEGSDSILYKGFAPNANKVALKMPRFQNGNDSARARIAERFQREVECHTQLEHPNIIQAIGYGYVNEQLALVMEYVDDVTAREYTGECGDESQMPFEARVAESLSICSKIAEACEYLHGKGYIHRDIKPDNIFVTVANGKLHPHLFDFGIVRKLGKENDLARGRTLGTSHYIPPEQAFGKNTDARSDVYSLGATLYHLIVGKMVFVPPSSCENRSKFLLNAHCFEEPPLIMDSCPEIPNSVEMLVQKALLKNPDERYQSMAEFRDAINAVKIDVINSEVRSL